MRYKILEKKNALITGASGGLGHEIAIDLANHGCDLYLTGRNVDSLEKLKEDLSRQHATATYSVADLGRIKDVNAVIADAKEKMNIIDILINCAGIFPVISLAETKVDDFENCFNVNVRASFMLCKAFVKDMVTKGWGRIVNIGSSSAYQGFANTSIYCASKHALLGFSRSLQDELKAHNVRVYCISPGSIKTEMGKKVKNQTFETFIDPKDIARYVSFVISFDSEIVSDEMRLNRMVIR